MLLTFFLFMTMTVQTVEARSARILYVFAPSQADPQLARQQTINKTDNQGFKDRDLSVIVISGSQVTDESRTSQSSAQKLRSQFDIPADQFKVILVGKDGGVKLTSRVPIDGSILFELIDSMPMRRQEKRERGR